MKKKLIFIFFFLFLLIPNSVFAEEWTGTNWASVQPSFVDWYYNNGYTNTYTSGSANYINSYPITGWANSYYSYGGSTDYLPYNFGWQWNNPGWCSNQSWTLKGRLVATGSGASSFFSNSFNLFMETDTSSFTCVTSQSYSNVGLWYMDYICSGTKTTKYKLLLEPVQLPTADVNIVNVSAWAGNRVSDLACNLTTSDIMQQMMAQNTQNTQNIIDSVTSKIQDAISGISGSIYTNSQTEIYIQNQNQLQTNQRLDNINTSINDDSTDSTYQNSTLDDLNSQVATNNVISDLLLLPVRMYQKILDSLGSNSCTAYNLGSLYGTDLILPCIQVQNYIGSALWTTIDLIFCGMFILVIRKKFVDIFNNMTNLKDGGNEIE